MEDIQKISNGRDTLSGHVLNYTLMGQAECFGQSGLCHAKIALDTGATVFIKSTQEYLEELVAQPNRAVTFIGEFVHGEVEQLGAESIVFWDEAFPV